MASRLLYIVAQATALLLLGLGLLTAAYQVSGGATLSLDVGTHADNPYLVRFNDREANKELNYRWSRDVSRLMVPGVGRGQSEDLSISMVGYRPVGAAAAVLTMTIGKQTLAVFTPSAVLTTYTATIPAALNSDDDLTISLISNAFSPPGDPRKLGVLVNALRLQANGGGGLVLPPISYSGWLLLSLLLLYLILLRLGLGWRWGWGISVGLMLLAAVLLATDRYDLTIFLPALGTLMISTFAMSLLVPPLASWLLGLLPNSKLKPQTSNLKPDIGWLTAIFLLAFVIKAGGMMHPQFTILDHGLRAHQVQELVADPIAFWHKYQNVTTTSDQNKTQGDEHLFLGQWNLQIPFPYPPTAYYVMAPVALFVPGARTNADLLLTVCDTILVALEGTLVFALYAMARKGLDSGRAGIIAAAIASFAPISYLHHSDGDWTYIWGGWVGLVYIMAVVCLADRAGKPIPFIILALLAGVALISHTATALFLGAGAVILTVLLWLARRSPHTPTTTQTSNLKPQTSYWPLLGSFVVGGLISLLYYGAYIGPMLGVAIPAIFGKIGSGASIGQDPHALGAPLLYGFFPQVWAHFTAWPLLLGLAGFALLLWRGRQAASPPAPMRFFTHLSVAWLIVFALFSLADLKMNLLQRHMLFVLPLLALLSGYVLDRLVTWTQQGGGTQQDGNNHAPIIHNSTFIIQNYAAWLLVAGLIAFTFVVGWNIWFDRVMHYVLPPGSG